MLRPIARTVTVGAVLSAALSLVPAPAHAEDVAVTNIGHCTTTDTSGSDRFVSSMCLEEVPGSTSFTVYEAGEFVFTVPVVAYEGRLPTGCTVYVDLNVSNTLHRSVFDCMAQALAGGPVATRDSGAGCQFADEARAEQYAVLTFAVGSQIVGDVSSVATLYC